MEAFSLPHLAVSRESASFHVPLASRCASATKQAAAKFSFVLADLLVLDSPNGTSYCQEIVLPVVMLGTTMSLVVTKMHVR
jgi:hypothetical protein